MRSDNVSKSVDASKSENVKLYTYNYGYLSSHIYPFLSLRNDVYILMICFVDCILKGNVIAAWFLLSGNVSFSTGSATLSASHCEVDGVNGGCTKRVCLPKNCCST